MEKIIIYQLLPRLFTNYKTNPKLNGTKKQNGCGKLNDISTTALTEIKQFGITHIWFTGVLEHASTGKITTDSTQHLVKGMAGSPYAITDYFDIAEDLVEKPKKKMSEFQALLKRTHDNGLKAIIDFIPNHVARIYSSDAKPDGVVDFGKQDDTSIAFSTQNDFYYLSAPLEFSQTSSHLKNVAPYKETPAKATGNDRFTPHIEQNDWFDTIKLNYGINYFSNEKSEHFSPIPSVWEKMRTILLYWAEKGVDGFRCDMVEMVPVAFWEWVIPQIKEVFPHIIFIAEIYNTSLYKSYIERGHFDYLYDKNGLYDTLRDITQHNHSASRLTEVWKSLEGITPKMLRFLENHDEQRLASKHFLGNAYAALPSMLATATMHTGALMIYAGQEIGEPAEGASGYSGDDGRTSIFDYGTIPELQKWTNKGAFDGKKLATWQQTLRMKYADILALAQFPAVSEGHFYDLMYANKASEGLNPHYIYAYIRYTQAQRLLFVLNFHKTETQEFYLKIPEHTFTTMQIPNTGKLFGKELCSQAPHYINESKETLINRGIRLKLLALSYAVYQLELGI